MNKPVSFDRVADVYDETRVLPPEIMHEVVERLIKAFRKNNCRLVLDAGSGTGRFAGPLQIHGLRVVGLDVARKMLARAQAKNVKDLLIGDISRMPFRDKCFDAVMSVHVLHLIKNWRHALTEINRVTKHIYSSVVTIFPDDPWPGQVYEELLIKHGWTKSHPGLHERNLPDTIQPQVMEEIAAFVQEKDANNSLEQLQQRCYSLQWEVPEDIHQKVMAELWSKFGEKKIKTRAKIFLYIWNVDQF